MLNAIMCVWNEEDIIAASVQNALTQGCENVYILDNGSTDRTVQQARKAGAVYYATFETDEFDEVQKTVYLNKCVQSLNKQLPGDKNWWLYLDADEFPDFGPDKTMRETLEALPPEVRAMACYSCNHLPTHEPYYIPGFHPVDFMPVGTLITSTLFKINLLRHDKGKPPLYSRTGAHTYHSEEEIIEAKQRFITHHFNYRRPEVTRKRLENLALPNAAGKRRCAWHERLRLADGVDKNMYQARLDGLNEVYAQNRLGNLKTGALDYNFAGVKRWYDPAALKSNAFPASPQEKLIWEGSQAYFLENYDTALFRFNDALAHSKDELSAGLLLLSMGRCYAKMADPTRDDIVAILGNHPVEEIRKLAKSDPLLSS